MKMNIDKEWLLHMAGLEANAIISVGGLVHEIASDVSSVPTMPEHTSDWIRNFPVSAMRKLRFTLAEGVPDAAALLRFFDVPSLEAWEAKWESYGIAFRQTQVFDARAEAVAAWVREAEIIASQLVLADFEEKKLRGLLSELRQLTRQETGSALSAAQDICARAGVAVVLVPELPGTRISGCARWLSQTHAMIGLTLRYKTDDQLWFTFFHEVAHLLLHRSRRTFVLDNAAERMGDDVIDSSMRLDEEEADRFAADTLIPSDSLADFLHLYSNTLTNDQIHGFAESIGIAPGIVIGRLQHDRILEHWQGNNLKQQLDWQFS